MKSNNNIKVILLSLFLYQSVTSLFATSLKDSVEKVLSTNPNVMAERKNQEAYRMYVDERRGSYLPTLDIESYYQSGREREKRDENATPTDGEWTKQNGYNAAIVLRQLIYDGGLTPSQVAQTKYQDLANKHRSFYAIENTILETVKSYTGLVQSDEVLKLTESMIKINEENLAIAKEQESISGEVLETYQVSSKLHFIRDRYIDEEDKRDTTLATYFKLVGENPKGKTCRPTIDETKIPTNLDDAIKKAVISNYKILEQIEKIKMQREKIAQANSAFLPKIDLELKASIDEDLELVENGQTDERYVRLNLNWNLFNGNKDSITSAQEKVFLAEQKKTLDDITQEIVAEIKSLFGKHDKYKRRVNELKQYVKANVNIVDVYRSEFQAGTRTFVDILDAERELYESTKTLIEVEYALINNYYDLMFNLSNLTDSVVNSKNQDCANIAPRIIDFKPKKRDNNIEAELEGLISDTDSELIRKELNLDLKKELELDGKTNDILNKNDDSKKQLNSFLEASKNAYTINLATIKDMKKAKDFMEENSLKENTFAFKFGQDSKLVKVIHGVYSSVEEAKKGLNSLNSSIVLSNKAYIDNISKHQKLYFKYN
ncbi:TolC family protein [Halarcobacter ebronensis]|uniref:TolC family protein n=1 Tax=Halarcobacter ebronensis TaxID=1462615 RepID=UPI003C77451C